MADKLADLGLQRVVETKAASLRQLDQAAQTAGVDANFKEILNNGRELANGLSRTEPVDAGLGKRLAT